jgi:phage-related protein
MGDEIVDHDSYVWQRTTSTFSSTHSTRAAIDSAMEKIYKRQEDLIQNLVQSQQHTLTILHVSPNMLNLSNSIW